MLSFDAAADFISRNVRVVSIFLDTIIFQLAWFVMVVGGSWLAIGVALLCLIGHLVLLRSANVLQQELRPLCIWLLVASLIGWCVESLLFYCGVLVNVDVTHAIGQGLNLGQVPVWMLCLWFCFALTFRFSLGFLQKFILLTPILGISACLSYAGGAALSDVVDLGRAYALVWIAIVWALVLPVLTLIYARLMQSVSMNTSAAQSVGLSSNKSG